MVYLSGVFWLVFVWRGGCSGGVDCTKATAPGAGVSCMSVKKFRHSYTKGREGKGGGAPSEEGGIRQLWILPPLYIMASGGGFEWTWVTGLQYHCQRAAYKSPWSCETLQGSPHELPN